MKCQGTAAPRLRSTNLIDYDSNFNFIDLMILSLTNIINTQCLLIYLRVVFKQ